MTRTAVAAPEPDEPEGTPALTVDQYRTAYTGLIGAAAGTLAVAPRQTASAVAALLSAPVRAAARTIAGPTR